MRLLWLIILAVPVSAVETTLLTHGHYSDYPGSTLKKNSEVVGVATTWKWYQGWLSVSVDHSAIDYDVLEKQHQWDATVGVGRWLHDRWYVTAAAHGIAGDDTWTGEGYIGTAGWTWLMTEQFEVSGEASYSTYPDYPDVTYQLGGGLDAAQGSLDVDYWWMVAEGWYLRTSVLGRLQQLEFQDRTWDGKQIALDAHLDCQRWGVGVGAHYGTQRFSVDYGGFVVTNTPDKERWSVALSTWWEIMPGWTTELRARMVRLEHVTGQQAARRTLGMIWRFQW